MIWQQSSLLGQHVGKRPFLLLEFKNAKPKCCVQDLISISSLHYHNDVSGKHLPKVLRQFKHSNAYSKHFRTLLQNLDIFLISQYPKSHILLNSLISSSSSMHCDKLLLKVLANCHVALRLLGHTNNTWPRLQITAFDQKLFSLSLMYLILIVSNTHFFSLLLFFNCLQLSGCEQQGLNEGEGNQLCRKWILLCHRWKQARLNFVGFGTLYLTMIEPGMSSSGTWSTLAVPNTRSLYLSWEGMCVLIIFIIIITIIYFVLAIIVMMIHFDQVCNSWRAEEQLLLWCGLWPRRDGEYYF